MPALPTIRIQAASALGYALINESDFDPARHRRYEEAAQPPGGDDLTVINGIGAGMARRLAAAGITTYAQLAEADPAALGEAIKGASVGQVLGWQQEATHLADLIDGIDS